MASTLRAVATSDIARVIAGPATLVAGDLRHRTTHRGKGVLGGGWDRVDAPFVESVLRSAGFETRVGAVRIAQVDDGTTSRARIEIVHAEGEGPRSIFGKRHAGFGHRLADHVFGLSAMEGLFYRLIRPLVPVVTPSCLHVEVDPLSHRFLILLEDVRASGSILGDLQQPINDEVVAGAFIDALADLHGRFWDSTDLRSIPVGRSTDHAQVLGTLCRIGLRRGRARLVDLLPRSLLDPSLLDRMYRAAEAMADSGPFTLVHADAHLGNLYVTQTGAPGFLDWQNIRRSSWAHDVGYFLVSALDVPLRQASEKALLDRYRRRLAAWGVTPPSPEAMWHRYRCSVGYGLAGWSQLVGLEGFQAPDATVATVQRFVAAAVDLDTTGALNL